MAVDPVAVASSTRVSRLVPPSQRVHTFNGKALVAFVMLAYGLSWAWVIPFAAPGSAVRQGDGWHGIYDAAAATRAATSGPGTIAAVVSALIIGQAIVLVRWDQRARRRGEHSVLGPR